MLAKNLDLRKALNHMISVSELGRGKASKIIQLVESQKEQYIVVKNNKPQAIIMSIEEYNDLLEKKEELELLLLASKRVSESSKDNYISFKDVLDEAGITEDELDEM
jgi:prevent-host-death family protein